VAGRPILERLIMHLMGHGVTDFYLSVNYLAHVIEDYFGDGRRLGCRITYLRETQPLGTGGPLSLLPSPPVAPLLVMNGDLVTQCNVDRMLQFHDEGRYLATFGVRAYSHTIPFGVARVDGDRLVEVREKPTTEMLINAGIYVLSPEAVAMVPAGESYPITDLFGRLLSEGRPVGAHVIEDDWIDVGRHEELKRARGEL
jgi:NDP-sugar pyrophosphorylase family protein